MEIKTLIVEKIEILSPDVTPLIPTFDAYQISIDSIYYGKPAYLYVRTVSKSAIGLRKIYEKRL